MKILRRILRILLVLFILLNVIAAFHAYKFTHFYKEGESGRKPEEMTAWQKVKTVLFGVNFIKSQNNYQPDSSFSRVEFKTGKGLRIDGWYMKADQPKGTVLLFHGHGSSKAKVLSEAYYMRSIGFNTLLIDFRAHGDSEGEACTIGYEEAEEVKLAYDYVRGLGEKNIFLWGISMGAAAITSSVHRYVLQPEGVILEMPFGKLKQAVKGRVRLMKLPEEPVSTLLTFWGGAEQGFWAFGHNPDEYAKQIHCPVLLQWGVNDPRVTRVETESVYSNLSSRDKKLVEYTHSGHESLCKKEPDKWQREISGFLLKR